MRSWLSLTLSSLRSAHERTLRNYHHIKQWTSRQIKDNTPKRRKSVKKGAKSALPNGGLNLRNADELIHWTTHTTRKENRTLVRKKGWLSSFIDRLRSLWWNHRTDHTAELPGHTTSFRWKYGKFWTSAESKAAKTWNMFFLIRLRHTPSVQCFLRLNANNNWIFKETGSNGFCHLFLLENMWVVESQKEN